MLEGVILQTTTSFQHLQGHPASFQDTHRCEQIRIIHNLDGLVVNNLVTTLNIYLLFRMANNYMAFTVEQQLIPALIEQGRLEEEWATWLEQLGAALAHHQDMNMDMFAPLVDLFVLTWPKSLTQRLHWGTIPHYGALGGISGFCFEATLDLLDYVVAETARGSFGARRCTTSYTSDMGGRGGLGATFPPPSPILPIVVQQSCFRMGGGPTPPPIPRPRSLYILFCTSLFQTDVEQRG